MIWPRSVPRFASAYLRSTGEGFSRWSILAASLSVGPSAMLFAYFNGVIIPKPGFSWVYSVGFPVALLTLWMLAFLLRCKHRKTLIFVTRTRAVQYCESCGQMKPAMHPLTRLVGRGTASTVEKSQSRGSQKPSEAKTQ
jgi:hypothetical protein